ncbi:hypothetical protein Taro_033846 [Colocasia esculenta]|uniref:Uncharacterized protein n=1 Tax=Colocasia esculenta TaxID=4460 RepID=A0A843VZ23_COLES|nr:hypothetical protein [Colocasia esculenta]
MVRGARSDTSSGRGLRGRVLFQASDRPRIRSLRERENHITNALAQLCNGSMTEKGTFFEPRFIEKH